MSDIGIDEDDEDHYMYAGEDIDYTNVVPMQPEVKEDVMDDSQPDVKEEEEEEVTMGDNETAKAIVEDDEDDVDKSLNDVQFIYNNENTETDPLTDDTRTESNEVAIITFFNRLFKNDIVFVPKNIRLNKFITDCLIDIDEVLRRPENIYISRKFTEFLNDNMTNFDSYKAVQVKLNDVFKSNDFISSKQSLKSFNSNDYFFNLKDTYVYYVIYNMKDNENEIRDYIINLLLAGSYYTISSDDTDVKPFILTDYKASALVSSKQATDLDLKDYAYSKVLKDRTMFRNVLLVMLMEDNINIDKVLRYISQKLTITDADGATVLLGFESVLSAINVYREKVDQTKYTNLNAKLLNLVQTKLMAFLTRFHSSLKSMDAVYLDLSRSRTFDRLNELYDYILPHLRVYFDVKHNLTDNVNDIKIDSNNNLNNEFKIKERAKTLETLNRLKVFLETCYRGINRNYRLWKNNNNIPLYRREMYKYCIDVVKYICLGCNDRDSSNIVEVDHLLALCNTPELDGIDILNSNNDSIGRRDLPLSILRKFKEFDVSLLNDESQQIFRKCTTEFNEFIHMINIHEKTLLSTYLETLRQKHPEQLIHINNCFNLYRSYINCVDEFISVFEIYYNNIASNRIRDTINPIKESLGKQKGQFVEAEIVYNHLRRGYWTRYTNNIPNEQRVSQETPSRSTTNEDRVSK